MTTYYKQNEGNSRIDGIWISSALLRQLSDIVPPTAIGLHHGGLYTDHRPVAVRLRLPVTIDPTRILSPVIAMGLAQRPRRVTRTVDDPEMAATPPSGYNRDSQNPNPSSQLL